MHDRWIAALDPRNGALPAVWLQYVMLTGPDLPRAMAPPPSPPRHAVVAAVTQPATPPLAPPRFLPAPIPRSGFVGVAESRDGRVAAAWTATSLYVTRNGGRTFSRALARTGAIAGALVNDDGAVFVLRTPRALGAQYADGTEAWRTMPRAVQPRSDDDEVRVTAVARGAHTGWLVVNPRGRTEDEAGWVALTDDDGIHWRTVRLPVTTDRGLVDLAADGAARVLLWESDCSYDDVQVYRLAPLARRLDARATRLVDLPTEARFDRDGWIHAAVTRPCYASEARCRERLDDYDPALRRQRITAARRAASAPWFYVAGGHLRHRTARQ